MNRTEKFMLGFMITVPLSILLSIGVEHYEISIWETYGMAFLYAIFFALFVVSGDE